ncbi:MAG: hypothetical protein OXN89_06700 [Bryobacterales bacterium]|nr:hypothetical protein [Bryobacterales bacterium]
MRSTSEHLLKGVSNTGLHPFVPDSLMRTTEVTVGFNLASSVRPSLLLRDTEIVLPSHSSKGFSVRIDIRWSMVL